VLEKPVREVLRLRRAGVLRDVRGARRCGIDAGQLTGMLGGRWLALQAVDAILTGQFRVRRPTDIDARMPTLMESWDRLW